MPKNKPPSLLPDHLLNQLLMAMPPARLRPERAALIKQNLLSKTALKASIPSSPNKRDGITTVRAGSGEWLAQMPGIETQILFDDGLTMTWLARFKAGARLAPHRHHGDEESTVLEGSCYVGEMQLNQGDYQLALAGSMHGEVVSPNGCLLLIRSRSPGWGHRPNLQGHHARSA